MDTVAIPAPTPASPSKLLPRVGLVLSALPTLFMLFDTIGKLLVLDPVVQGTTELGFPASSIVGIGVLELTCVLLYVFPRTSVLGAVLLTGYFGGAIATHVRMSHPLFSHTLFPVYFGVLVWGGLLLRDGALRAIFPFRRRADDARSGMADA